MYLETVDNDSKKLFYNDTQLVPVLFFCRTKILEELLYMSVYKRLPSTPRRLRRS